MLRQLTISEVIIAEALCIFAIGTTHVADPAAMDRKNEYRVSTHADSDYNTRLLRTRAIPGRVMTATCA